ncbi:hypothetical protein ACSSS7_007119 [Eimeria intestinalis]
MAAGCQMQMSACMCMWLERHDTIGEATLGFGRAEHVTHVIVGKVAVEVVYLQEGAFNVDHRKRLAGQMLQGRRELLALVQPALESNRIGVDDGESWRDALGSIFSSAPEYDENPMTAPLVAPRTPKLISRGAKLVLTARPLNQIRVHMSKAALADILSKQPGSLDAAVFAASQKHCVSRTKHCAEPDEIRSASAAAAAAARAAAARVLSVDVVSLPQASFYGCPTSRRFL